MVIMRLYGGLGNQMFQYAAGLALARRLGTSLSLDTRWFDPRRRPGATDHLTRPYQLHLFGIDGRPSVKARVLAALRRPPVFTEAGFSYQPEFERLRGDTILDGYWQSYRYFAGFEDEVRVRFAFPPVRSEAARGLLQRIDDHPGSVALHVRRGDYATSPKLRKRIGLLPAAYYQNALATLRNRVESPRVFVFSDDIDWCRQALALEGDVMFVGERTAADGWEDMLLMTHCRHHVIANSSFSWWGAWLRRHADGTVVAPERWFNDPAVETSDLIPPDWLRR
jgi:hypothetical protein